MDQRLPTDLITEEEAETYQILEQDQLAPEDDAETISSTSTADYDREEVEASLTNITDTFHMIAQECEKLTGTVPHMSKIQVAQVIAILPALKQELKTEKATETAKSAEMVEPVPGMSREPAAEAERPAEITTPEEVITEQIKEENEDEPDVEVLDEYSKKYLLSGKGKDAEEKIQEACKEINYQNLIELIAVGDYVVHKAKNIKEITKKWGLSFCAVQRAMSWKKEDSMGGRQYAKQKRMAEEQGEPAKKSQWLKKKEAAEPAKTKDTKQMEQSQGSTEESQELPNVPWTRS